MQVPSNMLITRIRPGIYMSAWMVVWAVVSGKASLENLQLTRTRSNYSIGCTALVTNYGGLVACRFFLGITEAPVGHFPVSWHPRTLSRLLTRRLGSFTPERHICCQSFTREKVSSTNPD
jgi:hypothetical protein